MSLLPYLNERNTSIQHVLLDANEHYEQWVSIPVDVVSNLNRYPDKSAYALKQRLSDTYCTGFSPDNIFISSGSIEAIDVIVSACKPRRIALNAPTYDLYEQRAHAHGVEVIKKPLLPSGQPDIDALLALEDTDMVVLINPNNPTGRLVRAEGVHRLLAGFSGVVIIDEAYIEFAGLNNSLQSFAMMYPNVIVLRTFSKAWGLAGIRLGYAIGERVLIEKLETYQNPYSVNAVALACGEHALKQAGRLQEQVDKVLACKRQLLIRLRQSGIEVFDTDANFILIHPPDTELAHRALKANGILVRRRPAIQAGSDCLRVTIGSQTDMEIFSRALLELAE